MRRLLIVSMVLAVGVLGSACGEEQPSVQGQSGGDGDTGHEHDEDAGEGHAEQGTVAIGGYEATNHGTADVSSVSEFQLELDDSYFGPTILSGSAGQELTLGLYNEGGAAHTFTIDQAGIDEELPSGADGISIDVTFPDSGALVFYCSFHREQGMVGALSVDGSLEVEEASVSSGGVYG